MPIQLHIIYGLKFEIIRVTETVKLLPWYRERGYGENHVRLPAGITEESTAEDIERVVAAEFDASGYEAVAEYLTSQWEVHAAGFVPMKSVAAFAWRDSFEVVLTKYGSGGSFDVGKGRVIVNIATREREKLVGTITHEIIHMLIQHMIKANNVSHWRKERLVDLIGAKYFPKLLNRKQLTPEDVSMIDQAFKAHSIDEIEVTIQELGA